MNLIIGTAQFGRPYGIANKYGKVPETEVGEILKIAYNNGIKLLDTGNDYGNSEEVLGRASRNLKFDFITKLYLTHLYQYNLNTIEDMIKNSMNKLQSKLFGLLVHNPNDLLSERGDILIESFLKAKNNKWTEYVGVSAGTVEQIQHIIDKYNIDMVQIPVNIFDQRFDQSGLIKNMKKRGIKIYVRSIFLQGLLLMSNDDLHYYFNDLRQYLYNLAEIAKMYNISVRKLAIEYAKSLNIDGIIVGVDNAKQLNEIITEYNEPPIPGLNFEQFAIYDEKFINPGNWPTGRWR